MKFSNMTPNRGEVSAPQIVNLSKGQKVNLAKVAPSATKILVGLGWDINRYNGAGFDLDAACFMLDGNMRCNPEGFIFYNNREYANGSVKHMGDSRTGAGEGDAEQIIVDLTKIPDHIQRIHFTVTIFEADIRHQCFGDISNSFIRLEDMDTHKEFIRCDLGEDFSTETAMVIAEFYRHNGEWKFGNISKGYAGGLEALCRSYGLDVE